MATEDRVCLQCGKAAGKHCARCQLATYCSEECQRAHWAKHKEECGKKRTLKDAMGGEYQQTIYAVRALNGELGKKGREVVVNIERGTLIIRKRKEGLNKDAFRTTDSRQVVVLAGETRSIEEHIARLAPELMEEKGTGAKAGKSRMIVKALVLCPHWPAARTVICGGFLVPLLFNAEFATERHRYGKELRVGGVWRIKICEKCTSANCEEAQGKEGHACPCGALTKEQTKVLKEIGKLEDAEILEGGEMVELLEYARIIRRAIGEPRAQVAWYKVERFWRAYMVGLDGRDDQTRLYLMNGPGEVLEHATNYEPRSTARLPLVEALALTQAGEVNNTKDETGLFLYYYEHMGLLTPDVDFMEMRQKAREDR